MMSYQFISTTNELITVEKLSQSFCDCNSNELLQIINTIPHIHSTKEDLLSQDEDYYKNKWNYSYIIKCQDKIIGVLIAYFRIADNRHIFDSLYIHRFAVIDEYQKIGIGTTVLKHFIQDSFAEITWLLNISIQTNNEPKNDYVIRLYKKIGFEEMYKIQYPDKEDVLLLFERNRFKPFFNCNSHQKHIRLPHPRLKTMIEYDNPQPTLPVVYFSSSNNNKRRIVEFIFHNYNIDVAFVTLPIELTEPQVEKPDIENERKLVSFPLKHVSRFITTKPCVIEDTMLFIEYFNRNGKTWELPGLDTKRWLRQLGLDGLLDIMGKTLKRNALFVSQTGAYLKPDEYYYGRGETKGRIALEKAKEVEERYGTYPFFFHLLFIPDGSSKTLAEMDMFEYSKYDYMRKSIVQLIHNISQKGTIYRQYTLFDLMN